MSAARSFTAEVVALCRAWETERRDPVVRDPFAKYFLSGWFRPARWVGQGILRLPGHPLEALDPGLSPYVAARHRCIDDALVDARRTGIDQVVTLGAGYDMRAFRLPLDGTRFVELDTPAMSRRKQSVLRRHRLHHHEVDYREVDFRRLGWLPVLRTSRLDFSRPAYVVWEGVSMYLTRAAVEETFDGLRRLLAPGSKLAADFWFFVDDPGWRATLHHIAPGMMHVVGEPLLFSLHPTDVESFLRQRGFQLEARYDASRLADAYLTGPRRVYPACYVTTAVRT